MLAGACHKSYLPWEKAAVGSYFFAVLVSTSPSEPFSCFKGVTLSVSHVIARVQVFGEECFTDDFRCFGVSNVRCEESNSHSTLSDRQPLLPGVIKQVTLDDWSFTGTFLSHHVVFVTLLLQCHCTTWQEELVTHLPCNWQASKIESFCKSFCSAKTKHGVHTELIPSDV